MKSSNAQPYYEQVAHNMLRRYGLAAVWQLQESAATAYRKGDAAAANAIAAIADAAEREWFRRQQADLTADKKAASGNKKGHGE